MSTGPIERANIIVKISPSIKQMIVSDHRRRFLEWITSISLTFISKPHGCSYTEYLWYAGWNNPRLTNKRM